MVAKINRGVSLYGAIVYNQQKVDDATARIIYGNRMITDVTGNPEQVMRQTIWAFENYLLANKNTEKPVLHIALNPAPEDKLTDEQLAELAQKYMQKMGYGDQPYIVAVHAWTYGTRPAHPYRKSTCVNDEEGRKDRRCLRASNRSMTACRELERRLRPAEQVRRQAKNGTAGTGTQESGCYPSGDVTAPDSQYPQEPYSERYRLPDFRGIQRAAYPRFNIEAKQVTGRIQRRSTLYRYRLYGMTDDTRKTGHAHPSRLHAYRQTLRKRTPGKDGSLTHAREYQARKMGDRRYRHEVALCHARHARGSREESGRTACQQSPHRRGVPGKRAGTHLRSRPSSTTTAARSITAPALGKEFSAKAFATDSSIILGRYTCPRTWMPHMPDTELWQHRIRTRRISGSAIGTGGQAYSPWKQNPVPTHGEEALARRTAT